METPRITLKKPQRFTLPPRAITRVALIESAGTLRRMQAEEPGSIPVAVIKDTTEAAMLKARVAELEARLHQQASDAWLEAEATLRTARAAQAQTRQHYSSTARVCDHTQPDLTPEAVITTDAVRLKLPLNPRTAVRMKLPVFSAIKRWLLRKP